MRAFCFYAYGHGTPTRTRSNEKGGPRKMRKKNRTAIPFISHRLIHELGMAMAEIARYLGVCTSAVSKAIRNFKAEIKSKHFQQRYIYLESKGRLPTVK
jgi:hypothetical protein